MSGCIFCRIVSDDKAPGVVYSDDRVVCFNDIDPKAPVHILAVPRKHIEKLEDATEDKVLEALHKAVRYLVKEKGLDKAGYRVVVNSGADGGQAVPHLHFHLLGGRPMKWPPG